MRKKLLFLLLISIGALGFSQKSHSDIIDVKEYIIVLDITDFEGK